MATYGKKAGDKVEAAMDERKKGTATKAARKTTKSS